MRCAGSGQRPTAPNTCPTCGHYWPHVFFVCVTPDHRTPDTDAR